MRHLKLVSIRKMLSRVFSDIIIKDFAERILFTLMQCIQRVIKRATRLSRFNHAVSTTHPGM